jgi:eukaryotic-like serine/threonine-protein kinase
MTSNRWEQIKEIFDAALEQPESGRVAFVSSACKGDGELEATLRDLLAAYGRAGSFLEKPAPTPASLQQPSTQTNHTLSAGSVVSQRFRILRFLGEGGMGQVYEALDTELDCRVALKTIRPDISADQRVLSRFKQEVQLSRRITHPNVCRMFDIQRHVPADADGTASGFTFLTMELLAGETLADMLDRRRRLSTAEALPLVLQMIEALSAAHQAGVVHRDFKPGNVMLVPTNSTIRVVVTDFGLARAVLPDGQTSAAQAARTVTGNAGPIGTLVYMAPEQLERGEATPASDIYALGLVMYEMVTGQRPFADPIPFAEASKRTKQAAPSPRILVPDLDPAWEGAIGRCLEREPEARFESAHAVAASISGSEQVIVPIACARSEPIRDWVLPNKRRRHLWTISIVSLLLVVSLLGLSLRYYLRRPAPIQFAERDWILVTDFANQTGEKVFDRVVRDLAVQSLSQSTYVNVVPRLSTLEAAKRTGLKEVNSIDEKLGRELCLRESYKALLSGNIFKNGSRYTIAMRVEVPGKDSASMSDTETIQSPDELLAAVDRMTARIRRMLGESLSKIETNTKPLAQVTTSSLEALQRYSAAIDLYRQGEYERCIALANDAVERDSNFAMAHLLLAEAYQQLGNENKSHSQVELARAALDHVGERERHLILAVSYSHELANEKAAEEYQHMLDVYPDDVEALKGFASEAFWGGSEGAAIAAQQRATALSPDDIDCYETLMALLVRTNRFAEALSVYSKADARHLGGLDLDFLRALATWGTGDVHGAQEMFRKLTNEGAYWKIVGTLYLGKLSAFQGQIAESIALFKTGLALVQSPDLEYWVPAFQYQIARAAVIRGDRTSRVESDRLRTAVAKAPTPANLQRAGSLSLQVGDLTAAKRMASLMQRQLAAHPDPFSKMEAHALNGDIALAQGRTSEAIQEQRTAIAFRQWFNPSLSLGDACAAILDWKCAIDAYAKYLEFKGAILRDDVGEDWVIAHYSLARAYLFAGDPAAAAQEYQEFLSLFHSADPDLPGLKNARREMHH